MAERKKFIDVNVPILQKELEVLGTPKDVLGKTIKLDLSRKLRGKGVIITLQVVEHDNKRIALPKRTEIIKSYLRKIIRKRTDTIEDSFTVYCADIQAKMKPILVTRKKVSRVVRKNLRNTAREFLMGYAKERTYYTLCQELLNGTLQRELLPKLKKVYPLAFCDLRVFESKDVTTIDIEALLKQSTSDENSEDEQEEEESDVQSSSDEEDDEKVESSEEDTKENDEDGDDNAIKK